MGIFDKAKDLLSEHSDKVGSGIAQAANLANERTGGQHAEQIQDVSEQIRDRLDSFTGEPVAEPAITEPLPAEPAEQVAPSEPVEQVPPTEPTEPADPEPLR